MRKLAPDTPMGPTCTDSVGSSGLSGKSELERCYHQLYYCSILYHWCVIHQKHLMENSMLSMKASNQEKHPNYIIE